MRGGAAVLRASGASDSLVAGGPARGLTEQVGDARRAVMKARAVLERSTGKDGIT